MSSHIETQREGDHVVLLGASNLTRAFPDVVDMVRARFQRPLRIVCAKGHGRSYGQTSRFLEKKFPGILECRLWDRLRADGPRAAYAILSDVGNDLAYETPVETITASIEKTLDHLIDYGATCVLNNVPQASLERVGAVRFHLMRRLLFPQCRLGRAELLHRAERLRRRLDDLAKSRKTPIFSAPAAWYGLDPIHPRRPFRAEAFRRMLDELAKYNRGAECAPMSRSQRRTLRRMRPAEQWIWGAHRVVAQPAQRLFDDADVLLY